MLKFIKNIFYPDLNDKTETVSIDYGEQIRKEREEAKAKWEADNELKKKHDACYLNTTKTAFYGTYEEYLSNTNHNNLSGLYQLASPEYLARMQFNQMQSNQMSGMQCAGQSYGQYVGMF